MHITSWSIQYRWFLLLQCICACESMTTTPGPSLTSLPDTLPLCNVTDPCLNGGTCREPEDWECSTSPGMGDTVCDCPTGFTGARCEKSTCGRCTGNEKCVLRNTVPLCVDGQDTRASTAPVCQTGPHSVTYNLKKRGIPAVCLDMYYTNSSSLCYDNDSSLSFGIKSQGVEDFFCLEIDYLKWQTCLRVNKTFTADNFPRGAVHSVTLTAEENDGHPRSAGITFTVNFNTAPNVTHHSKNFAVNMAAVGNQFTIDVPVEFEVTDADKLTYTLSETNSSHSINPTTGSLNVTLRDTTDQVIKIKINDDGVPSLDTEVTINLIVINFDCSRTAPQLYVDYNSIGVHAVGKLECISSESNMEYNKEYNQPQGIEVEINSNNLILIRNGSRGTYFLQVTLILPYNISVTVDIRIIIGDLLTAIFRMTNETWNPDLTDTSSGAFEALKNSTENEIKSELNTTAVIVDVLRFSPGSVWTYFTLLAQDKDRLKAADNALNASVGNGSIGSLPADRYRSFNGVGFLQSKPIVYNTSDVGNTPAATVNTTRVELKCEWFIILPVGEITIEWKMLSRNALIVPVDNSRFQIDTTHPTPEIYISTLTIDPIFSKDSGPFTCSLMDQGSLSAQRQLPIRVIAPPVLTLTPIRQAFINTTDSVTLVCNVTEPRNIITNITWFKDGSLHITEMNTTSRLTVLGSGIPNITYYCQGSNRAGDGRNSTATTVYILPPKVKQCPDDGTWPKTKAEEMAEALCPTGETGIMTRKCNGTGFWLSEDRSQCVSNNLQSVIDDVEYIEQGVQVSNLSTVAKNLSEVTKPRDLESKEIDLVLDTLDIVLNTARTTNLTEDKNETHQLAEGFVNTMSNIIDEQAINKWNYSMQDNSTNRPTQALNVVDNLTELVSESLSEGDEFTVTSPNIVLQVAKTDPNETKAVLFPDASMDTMNTNITSSVKLEAETIKALANGQSISYSVIYYKNITTILPGVSAGTKDNTNKTVNSGVWGINIFPTQTKKLVPPLELNFTHTNKTIYDDSPLCGYLDISTNTWKSDGCTNTGRTQAYTVCSCDHLTNFAILMSPSTPNNHPALSVITIIGCSISVFCLTLTVITYITLWKYVKSDQAIILMNICVFLGVAMLLFMLGVNKQGKSVEACRAVAVLLHLFFLLAFFMMLAAGLETLWTIMTVFTTGSKLKPLLIAGFVLPIIIVCVSMGATRFTGYDNELYCWLSTENGVIWAFIGPVLLVVLVNFGIIGKLVHSLLTLRFVQNQDVRAKIKKALRGMCVLIPLLGVSWVFGILAVSDKVVAFQYIFAILNSLQGLFIFITQCAIKKSVWTGLKSYHRQMRSKRMLTSELQSSQRRDASRRQRRGEGDSYQNLLQSQSVSEDPVQLATNERIQTGYRVPDSPRNVRRVDINRLGDTQETVLPDEPPPRVLTTDCSHSLTGTYRRTIAEEESKRSSSSSENSQNLLSTQRHNGAQQALSDDQHQRILTPGHSPHHFPSRRPSGIYQRAITEDAPQRLFTREQSPHLLPRHRVSGIYQRTIPEETPRHLAGRRPSEIYQKTLTGEPHQGLLPPPQSASHIHERITQEHPSERAISQAQLQRHRPSGVYQTALPDVSGQIMPSSRLQGVDNNAYQGDERPESSYSEHVFNFTQETQHTQHERDVNNGKRVAVSDSKQAYADEWSGISRHQDESNPISSGGHLHTAHSLQGTVAGDNPHDNFIYHSQPPVNGSSAIQQQNIQHSLPEEDVGRLPLSDMMMDDANKRLQFPGVNADNRHILSSDPNQQHAGTQLNQHNRNLSNVSNGQPRLDFVPYAVRGDTRRLSGATSNSPFLHSDMLGTTSHSDLTAMGAPFSAFRQTTTALKRRDTNA